MILVSDLDGTLANIQHRLPLTRADVIDWRAVSAAIPNDKPIVPMIGLLRLHVARGHIVHLMSGRSEETRAATVAWLARYQVPWHALRLRPAGDRSPNWQLKLGWLRTYPRQRVLFALDDNPYACRIFARLGVLPLQVGISPDPSQQNRPS